VPHINTKRPALFTVIAIVLVAGVCLLGSTERNDASAADGETAQLISTFNSYRAQYGVGALTTSASLNQNTQAAADQSAQACGFYLPDGSGKKWADYGPATAEGLWDYWQNDPYALPWIRDPKYGSVGVGRAESENCNLGYVWMFILSTEGGGSTPAPTPTHTPTVTPQPTQTPAGTPTQTPEPTATPFVQLQGDVNCDGVVNLADAVEIVKLVGDAEADTDCAGETGADCAAGTDEGDALALLRYLGGVPLTLPQGCPGIGSPVQVSTPAPSATPSPIPTATSGGAGDTDYCWLAMIAYDMTYPWTLNGEHSCEPADGAAHSCEFPETSNQVFCSPVSAGPSPYECYVYNTLDVPCVATQAPDSADYVCTRAEPIVCTSEDGPTYECTVVGNAVTCMGPDTVIWSPTPA
jgi:hypothetical protein